MSETIFVHPGWSVRPVAGRIGAEITVGYSLTDSAHLIAILQAHVIRLENTVRWRWTEGDVVIWDNRATQHYAIDDYGSQPRVVRRVTIAGDVPVGVDGRRSVTRKRPKAALEAAA